MSTWALQMLFFVVHGVFNGGIEDALENQSMSSNNLTVSSSPSATVVN